jgi:hypothetical protein
LCSDLLRPTAYIGILDKDEIIAMANIWQPLKKKLQEACNKAITTQDEAAILHAKQDLANTLREVDRYFKRGNGAL